MHRRPGCDKYRNEDEVTASSLRAFRGHLRRRLMAPRVNSAATDTASSCSERTIGMPACELGERWSRTLDHVLRGLAIGVACALALWLVAIVVLVALGKRSQARELVAVIPNLVVLFRGLLADPRVPRSSKRWLWFALAWCISPVDLIPEFVPVAGPLDDAIVAALVLRHVLRRTDRAVLADHWRGDPAMLDAIIRVGRPG